MKLKCENLNNKQKERHLNQGVIGPPDVLSEKFALQNYTFAYAVSFF